MASDDWYEAQTPAFERLFNRNAACHILHTGSEWNEGPAYFAGGRYLVWSDIPADRMLRLDETDDSVSVFRQPSGYANGNTVDRHGRLVTCEHGGRRVTRTEHDGSIVVIADQFEGRRLNSPNDVVVKSDGSTWFSDPSYGIDSNYQGLESKSDIGGCFVFRVDPATGQVAAVIRQMVRPNGLAFSLDEKLLYVVDSGRADHGSKIADLVVFDIGDDGLPCNGRPFANKTAGGFDGLRLDSAGRIWASAGTNVQCYDPDGTLLGRIRLPEAVSNCCFGGPKRNLLYITGASCLYRVRLMVSGAMAY